MRTGNDLAQNMRKKYFVSEAHFEQEILIFAYQIVNLVLQIMNFVYHSASPYKQYIPSRCQKKVEIFVRVSDANFGE